MNKFTISRLYLQNFKSIDEATVEFDGKNLNVLDGPNGFGKTTIYDAIQLLLTGSIRRVESNKIVFGNKGFEDHLFSKDQSKSTEITIEFSNIYDDTTVVLQRIMLPPDRISRSQKKPQIFEHYTLYKLSNFDDKSEKQRLSNNELDQIFGMKDMIEKFNLYQYIEQEESTYLFKKTDKARMNLISKLFNIEEEIAQKDYLEKVKSKLHSQKTILKKNLENIENNNKKEDFETITKGDIVTSEELKYKPLISAEKILNVPWDKRDISPIDSNVREVYMSEMDTIQLMESNKNDFKNELFNEQIDNVIKAENKLTALIVFGYFHDKFEEFKSRYDRQRKLNTILTRLREKDFMNKSIDWSFVFQYIDLPFNQTYIEQNIELINSYSKSADHISSLVSKMIETRDKLENQYKSYKDSSPQETIECPLCGDPKNSIEELNSEIKQRTELLKESLDADSKKYENMFINFYDNYIKEIAEQIEEWLMLNQIDSKFFNQLLEYKNVISDVDKGKKWFAKNNIQIENFINHKEEYINDIDDKVKALISELLKRKIVVSEECKDNITRFKRIFSDHLENDWNLLDQITSEAIKEKKEYIDLQYFIKTSNNFKESKKIESKIEKIDNTITIINSMLSKYKSKINSHRAKMLNDIEIPFYIYCGKIIQSHQRGTGVFIKEEKELSSTGVMEISSLSFIPPVDTDHDIVHSFSSGQLSSTVIAFTLALNKVYGNSGIMTLLIDDPIQTMDEMNMASFVELLRNDFNDRQLVISTHEDNVSLYIRYKFLKYRLSVGNINVKKNLYSK
ncbi:AAA family ATPase [Exiguobacterium sp. BRG2]|uniref:AAA family ATPase n=1 Tax=Exiguobacterium sp. BRG2 TaxID=2962584 RepID=UPI002882551C|nr:AAA family ATPase [Exiguobacterium sp. BRG2]MDT0173833.1 AAA family ATPase [Exiguobacterium sp. BRG2]